jgi:glucosylceramidase
MFGVMQGAISAGACSVLHGRLVSGDGGNALISVDEVARTFVMNPDYYVMRHLSCCILRNAVRLGLEGEWAGNAVAFVNEDDSYVLVVRNPHNVMKRLVLNDGQRLLVLMLQPQSFNTIVL